MSFNHNHEISIDKAVVDPRSFGTRVWDSLENPNLPLIWAVISGLITIAWPAFITFALIIFLVLRQAVAGKPDVLPIHLPLAANKIDKNDKKIGQNAGFYKARGAFFMGRIMGDLFEVWINFKALTQHFLIFGTTGSGKTESIVSYIVNFLSVGSGAAFQDAKAAPKAMVQIATMCRIFGRDDDMRVTNYITGQTSEKRDPASRLSNDAAVFARGSAEANTQLLVSLMPPSEGENKLFAERAVALVSAVFPALTDLRDLGVLQIDPGTIRQHMSFNVFSELFKDNRITKRSRDALLAYLESLPGYDKNKGVSDQPEEVTRQFGFAQAYFTRSLSSLSDTYGHIYMVGQGEIDYQDVVLNGRVLLTLLPSMEKSGEELSNLGKIVLTATKNGMVVGLGTVFEGSAEEIVHNLPTNSEIPFPIINDENAYMLVEGQEIMNAQARGLGFAVFTGTQDAPGMLENISRTTKQIMANSAVKQIGFLDDKETTQLAMELSGEANVLVRNQFERQGDLGNIYAGRTVSLEKRTRITETEIKRLDTGQAFIMYKGRKHEVQLFNHGISEEGPDPLRRYVDHWFPVRLAKVRIPREDEILKYMQLYPRQEWEDMLLMIRDSSRQMQREMESYFASQAIIRNVAKMYAENDFETLEKASYTFTARAFLDDNFSEPTGLVATIAAARIETLKDVAFCLAELARTSASSQIRLQKEADLTGLDDFDNLPLLDPIVAKDDEDDVAGSSSGGGTAINPATAPEDALAAFLGPDYGDAPESANAAPATIEGASEAAAIISNQAPAQATEENARAETPVEVPAVADSGSSPVGMAVANSLAAMPWMSSPVEYQQLKESMYATEMMFNDDDETAAKVATDEGIELIIKSLEYPQTQIPASREDRFQELFKGWLE